jgi:predicted CXXCH cytochrome family protein
MNRTPRLSWAFTLGSMLLVLACGGPVDEGGGTLDPGGKASQRGERVFSAVEVADGVCSPTGAHGRHDGIMDCKTCHACGGAYEFTATSLPGGTSTAGGVINRDTSTSSTTCSVGCHDIGGQSLPPVSWSAVGPLACTSCHAVGTGAVSKHAIPQPDPLDDRAGCGACHVTDRHLSGTVRIAAGDEVIEANRNDPAALSAACQGCHDGAGKGIDGFAPPVLAGWSDLGGDFHGSRIGVGSAAGATLKAPYVRGQPPLPCTSCHEAHSSPNAFLFAAPAPIDRAGVGAERLCASCHEGERHALCISCHGADPMPAGNGCFYCHGHEGVVNFPFPSDYQHDGSEDPSERCDHCHTNWAPPALEYGAPVIVSDFVNVQGVGNTAVTITWSTNEPATSFVEWGTSALDHASGDGALVFSHSVAVTGLQDGTTYSFRARSVDGYRNVTRSALLTFQTPSANAPTAPTLVAEPDATVCLSPAVVTLEWLPVTDPNGDPVEYRLLVDDSALFDSPVLDTGWVTATQYTRSFAVTTFWSTYYWNVQARDAANALPSPVSTTDSFRLNRYRVGTCP